MNSYLLDTHVWIWLQERARNLPPAFIKTIDEARGRDAVFVSAISVWEIGNLVAHERLSLNMTIDAWLHAAFTLGNLQLVSLGAEEALLSTRLPGGLHRDPADRMLVSTALLQNLTLVSHDKRILEYALRSSLRVLRI